MPWAKRLRVYDLLEFDLDSRAGSLRRIILYLPRPVAEFFTNQRTKQSMEELLDGGWKCMLWLVGQDPLNVIDGGVSLTDSMI